MVIWGWGWIKTLNILAISRVMAVVTAAVLVAAWSHDDRGVDDGIVVNQSELPGNADFPLKVGGDFELIDHHGKWVTNETYKGRHMLVFFGYVNCKNMCSISLSRIGKALELLGDSVNKLTPLVITVDPERDTPAAMKSALTKFHPNFIGLTGKPQQLQAAYQNYKQRPRLVGNDPNNDPIISHSSYIYLMDRNGEFATLFPPALNPERMADIIRKHIDGAA
ncbi:SCO family protein [Candidatus Spongiihabitans sp.]|uniref:SCO family protein n=1 Tax=Candidatus Spongiihabitans sp. TaxID=3101308 RepID=UPI003C7A24B6